MIRDFMTEFRWFWCGAFLLAAESACPQEPQTGINVRARIRAALDAMPTD